MGNFNQAFKITMANEGGYCNNYPRDKGGETWRGVTRNFWPKWQGWSIVDEIKLKHPVNLNQALAANDQLESLVLAFYKANFWDCLSLDSLKCQQIADQLFDISVNMGTGIAAKFLQEAINNFTRNSLVVDSKVGPKTIDAANVLDMHNLYNKINDLRKERYDHIIANDSTQAQFKHSWYSRIKPFEEETHTLA